MGLKRPAGRLKLKGIKLIFGLKKVQYDYIDLIFSCSPFPSHSELMLFTNINTWYNTINTRVLSWAWIPNNFEIWGSLSKICKNQPWISYSLPACGHAPHRVLQMGQRCCCSCPKYRIDGEILAIYRFWWRVISYSAIAQLNNRKLSFK